MGPRQLWYRCEGANVGMAEPANLAVAVSQNGKALLEQLRMDFKLVWNWWRHCGEISEDEMRDGMKEAGEVIRKNMGKADWMRDCAATFSEIAAPIRADLARAARIRAGVRAEKEAACETHSRLTARRASASPVAERRPTCCGACSSPTADCLPRRWCASLTPEKRRRQLYASCATATCGGTYPSPGWSTATTSRVTRLSISTPPAGTASHLRPSSASASTCQTR